MRTFGEPAHPTELATHEVIQASTIEPSTNWQFSSSSGNISVKVKPRLYCSQNGAAVAAAKNGFGITRQMSYQVGQEIKEGRLVRLLRDFEPKPLPVHIIHLEGRQANAKIRTFIDLAVERLRENPYIDHD